MQSARLADNPRDPSTAAAQVPDFTDLLGEWRNCDESAQGVHSFVLREGDSHLVVRVIGRDRSGLQPWGEVAASGIFFESVEGGSVAGFIAELAVAATRCRLQVNLKLGVAVVGGFYRDEPGARRLFHREFFYRVPA